MRQWMNLFESLTEAPVGDITYHGDFSVPGAMDDSEKFSKIPVGSGRRMVQTPAYQHALKRFFARLPQKIYLYFCNGPRGNITRVWKDTAEFKKVMGYDCEPKADGINFVITDNEGDEAVRLTPWIVAHRLSHAILGGGNWKGRMFEGMRTTTDNIAQMMFEPIPLEHPYRDYRTKEMVNFKYPDGKQVVCALATSKMFRDEVEYIRYVEWFHECFAEYILKGHVTVLPSREARRAPGIPEFGVQTYWPMKENPDYDAIDAKMKALIKRMEASFEKMLTTHVGPFLITI